MIATLTMCSLDFDEDYIPHFFKYYNSQGVDRHLLILHSKEPADEKFYLAKYSGENTNIFFVCGEWNANLSKSVRHGVLKKMGVGKNDWVINLDIDEHVETDCGTLKAKIEQMVANGENCCRGRMIDRIAIDGSLPEIKKDQPLSNQFPLVYDFTRKVLRAESKKIPITRGDLSVTGGSHYLTKESKDVAVFNPEILIVEHYKWSSNVVEKLKERFETHKNIPHRKESGRFLQRWVYKNSLIDKDADMNKDFMFFAIPKCASISSREFCDVNNIEYVVHNYDFTFIKAKLKNKKSFCILRNPVERVVSAYCFLKNGGKNNLRSDIRDWRIFCEPFSDINDFVKNGLERASKRQLHFLPQSFWVDMMKDPHFLYLETLQQGFDNLCGDYGLNKLTIPFSNVSDKSGVELTSESNQIINNVYKKDVKLYMPNINPQG